MLVLYIGILLILSFLLALFSLRKEMKGQRSHQAKRHLPREQVLFRRK